MNKNHVPTGDQDALLENFAADLANAAYPIALRHGKEGSWVDLELHLWKVLADKVKKWGPELLGAGGATWLLCSDAAGSPDSLR